MLFVLAALVVGVLAVVAVRQSPPAHRGVLLRRFSFAVGCGYAVLFALFVAGETFTDPGGWEAVGLVAAWAVPLAALVALALLRPDRAAHLLVGPVLASVALDVWAALDRSGWHSFEDAHGPARTIVAFVVGAALTVLGLHRPRRAGVLLLVLGLTPSLVALGSDGGVVGSALAAASAPLVVPGVLYLLAASVPAKPAPPARPDRRLAPRA